MKSSEKLDKRPPDAYSKTDEEKYWTTSFPYLLSVTLYKIDDYF